MAAGVAAALLRRCGSPSPIMRWRWRSAISLRAISTLRPRITRHRDRPATCGIRAPCSARHLEGHRTSPTAWWRFTAHRRPASAPRAPRRRRSMPGTACRRSAPPQNNMAGTEQCLRAAIAAHPTWFKPHWMLAQVLRLQGRDQEAGLANPHWPPSWMVENTPKWRKHCRSCEGGSRSKFCHESLMKVARVHLELR